MVRPLTREPLERICDSASGKLARRSPVSHIRRLQRRNRHVAMILKKVYEAATLARSCLLWICLPVIMAFFVFRTGDGIVSSLGLMAKSLVIDDVIENINLCKCFSIICDDPGPICDYIING